MQENVFIKKAWKETKCIQSKWFLNEKCVRVLDLACRFYKIKIEVQEISVRPYILDKVNFQNV